MPPEPIPSVVIERSFDDVPLSVTSSFPRSQFGVVRTKILPSTRMGLLECSSIDKVHRFGDAHVGEQNVSRRARLDVATRVRARNQGLHHLVFDLDLIGKRRALASGAAKITARSAAIQMVDGIGAGVYRRGRGIPYQTKDHRPRRHWGQMQP